MKTNILTAILLFTVCSCFAQNNPVLIRHDTTLLRANECEWIVRSLVKNDPTLTGLIGKSVPQIIMMAIEKNMVKAFDPETGKQIPAKKIYEWNVKTDTIVEFDNDGNVAKYIAVKSIFDPAEIKQIRIFHDWYFNVKTNKFQPQVKWIELMKDVIAPSGMFIGYLPYCRIYY